MDKYFTKKNIMIGSGVLVVVIIIIVVACSMKKKDNYTYAGGKVTTTSNVPGPNTTWPTVVLGNLNPPQPPTDSTLLSLVADNVGNLTVTAGVPIGGIIMWSGTKAPNGWSLCDGSNSTPDLRGRFVVSTNGDPAMGLTNLKLGDCGGEEFHQLTVAEMPAHFHQSFTNNIGVRNDYSGGIFNNQTPTGVVSMGDYDGNGGQGGTQPMITSAGGDPDNKTLDFNTQKISQTLPHNNMPPFYALAYIMKIV